MITIKEIKNGKLPSYHSILIHYEFYNDILFKALMDLDAIYDKKTRDIETLPCHLAKVVNICTKYDDVEFISLPEEEEKEIKKIPKSFKFKVKPMAHQIEGIEYILSREGSINLYDMGLGKTYCAIVAADVLKCKHVLVICGVSSLKSNWKAEIEKFSDSSSMILDEQLNSKGKVKKLSTAATLERLKAPIEEKFIIINKEKLQGKEFIEAYRKSKNKIDMIVVDEGHKLVTPTAKSVKTLLKLDAPRKLVLTGTIITNVPENTFVPLKWIDAVDSNFTQFKQTFNVYGGFGNYQVIRNKNLDTLKDLISKYAIRKTKDEVLDLPPKTYNIEYVDMYDDQKALYDEVEKGIAEELDKLPGAPTVLQELAICIRLRQITENPGMLSTEVTNSGKLDRLYDLVDQIVAQGEKVVIFDNFKETCYKIAEELKSYHPVICTGDQSNDEIDKNKKIFTEDPKCKVLIGTHQKMGTGHTLTVASHMIFVSTPWTSSDLSQATDRIYRIGQNKPVFITTLITKNSYDERVQEIIEGKAELGRYLVGK